MSDSQETRFSELVAKKLTGEGEEVRALWIPMAQEFNRGGSDQARLYLDGHKQQLQDRMENLFSKIDEG